MPTYEYRCTACGEHLEVFQSFSDDPLDTCGICNGRLSRVFHPVGIVFKGSGFYSTDSRSNKAATSATSKSSSESTEQTAEPSKSSTSQQGSDNESKIA